MGVVKKYKKLIILGIIICVAIIGIMFLKKTNHKKDVKINYLGDEITMYNINRIPIFAFHRLMSSEDKEERAADDEWIQSVDIFEEQMDYLYRNGFKTISMDQLYCWYKGDCIFDTNTVVITFDDGNDEDYFLALPILEKYNFKATSFIVGTRTEEDGRESYDSKYRKFITQKMIEDVKEKYPNFEFQSHTWNLHRKIHGKGIALYMSEDGISDDFEEMEYFNFSYIAYPYGHYNDNFKEIAKKNNYKLAFTFGPNYDYVTRHNDPYEIPRIKINGESSVETIKSYFICN